MSFHFDKPWAFLFCTIWNKSARFCVSATAYPMAQWSNQILVGGFNPFEQYSSNWITSPSRGENKKIIVKPPPRIICTLENTYEKNYGTSAISIFSETHQQLDQTFPLPTNLLDRPIPPNPHLPFIERSCPTHVRHIQDVKIANTCAAEVGWLDFYGLFFQRETGNLIILLVG